MATTTQTPATAREALAAAYPSGHEPVHNYLKEPTGLKSWLLTVDHKRIGIMYLVSVSVAFIASSSALLLSVSRRLTLLSVRWVAREERERYRKWEGGKERW